MKRIILGLKENIDKYDRKGEGDEESDDDRNGG